METDLGEANEVVAELRIVVVIVLDDRLGCLSRELYSANRCRVQLFRLRTRIAGDQLPPFDCVGQILIPTYNQHGGNSVRPPVYQSKTISEHKYYK